MMDGDGMMDVGRRAAIVLEVTVSNGVVVLGTVLRLLPTSQDVLRRLRRAMSTVLLRSVVGGGRVLGTVDLRASERRRLDGRSLRALAELLPSGRRGGVGVDAILQVPRTDAAAIRALASRCPVRGLVLAQCDVDDAGAALEALDGGVLRRLEIHRKATGISPSWVCHRLARFSALESLALTSAPKSDLRSLPTLSAVDLRAIGEGAPGLVELDVSNLCGQVSVPAMTKLMRACRRLACLRAGGPRPDAWSSVLWGASLRVLDIGGPTNTLHLERLLAISLARVDLLDLDWSDLTFLNHDLATPPPVSRFGGLRSFSASGARLNSISSSVAATFLGSRLCRLDLSRAYFDFEAFVRAAAGWPSLTQLGLAAVDHNAHFSDLGLTRFLQALPPPSKLRFLDVRFNDCLTPYGVVKAVRALTPFLAVLHASELGRFGHAVTASAVRDTRIIDLNGRRGPAAARSSPVVAPRCQFDACGARGASHVSPCCDAYNCWTCSLFGDAVICAACARACHVGHDLRFAGHIRFFCDCPLLTAHHHCAAFPDATGGPLSSSSSSPLEVDTSVSTNAG